MLVADFVALGLVDARDDEALLLLLLCTWIAADDDEEDDDETDEDMSLRLRLVME